jgi:SAM-dependent methyltransferase
VTKLVVGPMRYGRRHGYDAERYWRDRFRRHGRSLVAAGNEGQTEEENSEAYRRAAAVFGATCTAAGIDFVSSRVVEVGPGTGYYTDLLAGAGVTRYLGIDITDALFEQLRDDHPGFEFVKRDVTAERIDGEHDVAVMIDVVEHIVERSRFDAAVRHVLGGLAEGGRLVIGPLYGSRKRRLFYVHWWTVDDLESAISGLGRIVDRVPFRTGTLAVVEARPARAR